MKSLYLLILIVIGFCLSSCAATPQKHYTQKTNNSPLASNRIPVIKPLEKSPFTIAMYTEGEHIGHASYKILGTETISKYNESGIKRQTASIHDAMSSMAAKMGGDAIINIANDDKKVTGTVISYQDSESFKATG
ncbi:MAG: hypothetical protein JO131_05550 [Gammaproteobacteria bacterium]|nr:hypothetical protein [Gammaproteobacteria bacterium]